MKKKHAKKNKTKNKTINKLEIQKKIQKTAAVQTFSSQQVYSEVLHHPHYIKRQAPQTRLAVGHVPHSTPLLQGPYNTGGGLGCAVLGWSGQGKAEAPLPVNINMINLSPIIFTIYQGFKWYRGHSKGD